MATFPGVIPLLVYRDIQAAMTSWLKRLVSNQEASSAQPTANQSMAKSESVEPLFGFTALPESTSSVRRKRWTWPVPGLSCTSRMLTHTSLAPVRPGHASTHNQLISLTGNANTGRVIRRVIAGGLRRPCPLRPRRDKLSNNESSRCPLRYGG
jgi:hypothetical protein